MRMWATEYLKLAGAGATAKKWGKRALIAGGVGAAGVGAAALGVGHLLAKQPPPPPIPTRPATTNPL